MIPVEAALAGARAILLLTEALVAGSLVLAAMGGARLSSLSRRLGWGLLALFGAVWVVLQSVVLAEASGVGDGVRAIAMVLQFTRVGHVALVRLGLWAVAAMLSWRHRGIAAVAAVLAVALHGAAGHAGAGDQIWVEMSVLSHIVAGCVWIGSLPALLVTLRRPDPALVVRRFEWLGLACVVVIVGTAIIQVTVFAGGLPGLVGTLYGRLLVAKLLLFVGMLALAARNRFVLRDHHARLRRSVRFEVVLGVVVLGIASVLSGTPPGAHEQAWWPFPWRLDLSVLDDDDLRQEPMLAFLALIAGVGILAFATFLQRRRWVAGIAAILPVFWAVPHLSVLFVPAEPSFYWASPSDPSLDSIATGKAAYAVHCASCHGAFLRGDGERAAGMRIPPADLTASHLGDHPDGQLFWFISDGMRGPDGALVMPGFAKTLDAATRWALIDFLRDRNPYSASGAVVHRHGS